jgi:hypothetical protein
VATVNGATHQDDCGPNEATGQVAVPLTSAGTFTVTASLRNDAGAEVVPAPPAQTHSTSRCEDILTDYFAFYINPF